MSRPCLACSTQVGEIVLVKLLCRFPQEIGHGAVPFNREVLQISVKILGQEYGRSNHSSSMMRYLVKFHEGLDEGLHPVTYKNARFGSLSILTAARSNSDWK